MTRSKPKRNVQRALITVTALGLLAACAAGSQKRAEALTKIIEADTKEIRVCMGPVYDSRAYDPIRRRLPIDIGNATLEQQTDPSMANDVEIAALMKVHPQLQACVEPVLEKMLDATPSLVPIYAAMVTLGETSLIEVMQKKKNWGDHVHDLKENQTKTLEALTLENEKVKETENADPKAKATRRVAADKVMDLYRKTEKIIDAMKPPVSDNCTRFGGTVNCASR